MEEVVKKRGGARPGAGRKNKAGLDCAVTFRISHLAKERLMSYAATCGISMQEATNRIFEDLSHQRDKE